MIDANGATHGGLGSGEDDGEETTHGGLTIARYGEIMAHVRYFPRAKKHEVLACLGVDEEDWEEAVSSWTDALADASEREDEGLSRQFGLAVAQTKDRLAREKPPIASLGPLPGEREKKPATAQQLPLRPVVELSAPPPAQPIRNLAPPPLGLVAPPVPPTPVAPAFVMPKGMRHWTHIHGTQPALANAPVKPALPFSSGEPGDRSGSPSHAAAPAEASRALGPAAPRVGGETLDISSVVAAVLAQGSSVRPASAVPQGTPDVRTSLAPHDVLPADAAPGPPTLTLEQYASLCVEFAAAPGQAQEISSRYGLTQEQWTNVNAYWTGRMSSEPAVRAAWERACVTYRQWLMRR
ncbi:hypothetical protein [Sorangium sp. So ce363]|uniref:hypothetical protein n=1 Tax=Sorangium sp. So ce363 TaxID=3133304 RepID=UPI003F645674